MWKQTWHLHQVQGKRHCCHHVSGLKIPTIFTQPPATNLNRNLSSLLSPLYRFITRMIPIQATCFASSAEIKATVEELLQKFFFPNKNYKSFAVSIQKRICNNVKKPEIIDMIAGRILDSDKKYKVSLDNPDATIVVEVVRTLCGIAVVPSTKTEMKHFNLLNARQKASSTVEEWANDGMHVIGKNDGRIACSFKPLLCWPNTAPSCTDILNPSPELQINKWYRNETNLNVVNILCVLYCIISSCSVVFFFIFVFIEPQFLSSPGNGNVGDWTVSLWQVQALFFKDGSQIAEPFWALFKDFSFDPGFKQGRLKVTLQLF